MSSARKVVVVTGASQGIGAGLVRAYRDRHYHVVASFLPFAGLIHANSLEVAMAITIKVNGRSDGRCRRRHAAALGAARRARHDRHEVRLRHGAVRRLHGACRRRRRRVPASPRSTASAASEITTIEAIGATPAGAKIQKAWLDLEVVQCGYCQSGQIMSASALLASNPQPDRCRHRRRDVRQHLPLRHLCPHPRSDQAGRAIERTGRLTMILDHITSRAADSVDRHRRTVSPGAVSCRPERPRAAA